MAKTKISEFSATPANNTDIDSINIAEGCAPSGINDAIRELMAQLKDFQTGAVGDSFNGPVGTSTAAAGAFTTLAASGAVTLSGGTANGVTYLNGSKVLTSGSALVFDGTNMGIGTATPTFAAGGGIQNKNATFASFRATGGASTGIDFAQGSDSKGYVFNRDNADIIFGTNSAERIRILSSGEVGIGTSSPAKKLDILSNTSQDGIRISGSANPRLTIIDTTTPVQFDALCTDTEAVLRTDTNHPLVFSTNGTERMRLDSSGNLGLGVTPSAWTRPAIQGGASGTVFYLGATSTVTVSANLFYGGSNKYIGNGAATQYYQDSGVHVWENAASGTAGAGASMTERMRIDSSGNLLVGTTNTNPGGSDINGIALRPGGFSVISALGATPFGINRGTDDGTLINFSQAGSTEGSISVSGTTVSYNGGHLSRWAQTTTTKDESLVKGTVLSNLDEMNVYTKDGQPVDNEQLNKVKVSDIEGDANVAGVFVNWSHDEEHNVDEINMAMTGDMIIRIAQGVTVVRGDLLMSAGDGTAKPQGDDIVRSKTVAKVTSNHITCTYADGSYCVPCVLMAC